MAFPDGPLTGAPLGIPTSEEGNLKEFWEDVDGNTNFLDVYRVRNTGGNGNFKISFRIPSDFAELTSLSLILSNTTDVEGDIQLSSAYGKLTESVNLTTESQLVAGYSLTALVWASLDVSGVFSQLRPDDYCGVRWDHQDIGTSLSYIGLYGTYA